MNNYLEIRALYHSVFAEEEKARRKAALKNINRDFFQDLPCQVCNILDELCWTYKDQPWFEEAWEKYRKHVLDAGLGGKIKMPGFVFNEYIDKYVDEQEKKMKKELVHMDTCDIEELCHHGVKGQRWGVRRYQKEDGTLTAEGKARYGVDENGKMSKEGKKLYAQDRKDQKVLDRSSAHNALSKAAKTGGKYLAAELITAGIAVVGSKLMMKSGNLEGAEAVVAGARIVNGALSTVGSVHMAVSAVKGANEKEKILDSQKQGN